MPACCCVLAWNVVLILIAMIVIVRLIIKYASWKNRRLAVGHSKRILNWEFWPLTVFYIPAVCYILYLGLGRRSLTLFSIAILRAVLLANQWPKYTFLWCVSMPLRTLCFATLSCVFIRYRSLVERSRIEWKACRKRRWRHTLANLTFLWALYLVTFSFIPNI